MARELHRGAHRVSVFAASGSDLGFPVGTLPVSGYREREASRADVAAPPEQWMGEHHAYLHLMMGLVRRRGRFDVIHNNSLHHLPIAMADAVGVPC